MDEFLGLLANREDFSEASHVPLLHFLLKPAAPVMAGARLRTIAGRGEAKVKF